MIAPYVMLDRRHSMAIRRDVRNRFFISVRLRFGFAKKTRIMLGMSLVLFGFRFEKNAVHFGYYSYLRHILILRQWMT